LKCIKYCALALILVITAPPGFADTYSALPVECYTLYFINGISITNSTISEDLVLETPLNISLPAGFEQVTEHIASYNVVFNNSLGAYTFRVEAGRGFVGFFANKVRVCTSSLNAVTHLLAALNNPSHSPFSQDSAIPRDVVESYVRTPHGRVVEVVVPAYEEWFREKYEIGVRNASLLGIAATAALFVYLDYFNYSIGEIPRSIDEAIRTRQGDCDDMSRVLVELLNYYGIPSIIVSGYVYIDSLEFNMQIRNVTYVYMNGGPHAFAMAYIPGLGWISLDFLAGSLLSNPFIIEGYTRDTSTPSEEEVEEFYGLHSALKAVQVIATLTEDLAESHLGSPITTENLIKYLNGVWNKTLFTETPHTSTVESTHSAEEPTQHPDLTERPVSPSTPYTLVLAALLVLIVGAVILVLALIRVKGVYTT